MSLLNCVVPTGAVSHFNYVLSDVRSPKYQRFSIVWLLGNDEPSSVKANGRPVEG